MSWSLVCREIKRIFSSASIINGCFIEKRYTCKHRDNNYTFVHSSWDMKTNNLLLLFDLSGDKHYKTGRGHSGLDLSLARLSFVKLAKRESILSEVCLFVCLN